MKVAVVGGGITGLAAAYRLSRLGADVRLFEKSERTGGIVETHRAEGRVLEGGPDCFLTRTKPWAHELALELGLERDLVGTTTEFRRSLVLARGRLEPIPHGFHLIAPTSAASFLRSRILSCPGRLRALAEISIQGKPQGDESLHSFVERRFGRELFARLAEPLVAGIYTADPRELSLRATFPQFLDMERACGSVTAALWNKGVEASGARYGLFATFRGGVQVLTDALRERLPRGAVETGSEVLSIRRADRTFVLEHARGEERADRLLVALPGPQASRVLQGIDAELARMLGGIRYAAAATVNFVLRREQVRHPLDAMGFVCPAIEKRFLLACTFSSTKFAGRADEGEVLLRAFVGGAQHEERALLPPAEIAARALEDLVALLGIRGDPLLARPHVMRGAMPQYTLGHVDRARAIEAQVLRTPGLATAGNALHGVGIPDCVRSAERAARSLMASIG